MSYEHSRVKRKLGLVVILFLGFGLLVFRLEEKSLWGDETYTVEEVRGLAEGDLRALMGPPTVHPPLYFVCLYAWTIFAGEGEFALRFPSVVFGVLSVAMVYPVATRTVSGSDRPMTMGLMAISPVLVAYSRMARYYSLALFLIVVSYWFFDQLLHGSTVLGKWVAYVLSATLAMYTAYFAAFVLFAQAAVALIRIRQRQKFVLRLLASQLVVIVLFAAWVPVWIAQASRIGLRPSGFGGSGVAMLVLSGAYPFFAWSVGETIYPWNPAALLGSVLGVVLAGKGLWSMIKMPHTDSVETISSEQTQQCEARDPQRLSPLRSLGLLCRSEALAVSLFVFLPLLLTVATLRYFTSGESFLVVPSKALFCVPFFYVMISKGLSTIARPGRRLLAVTVLGLVVGVSLSNYYAGREFHNPNQALPTRTVAQMIAQQREPGDVFVSDHTTAFSYYIGVEAPSAVHFFAYHPQAARGYIAEHQSPRVWLVLLCRAVETESLATTEVVPWLLNEGYSLESTLEYGPLDEIYGRVQELVLSKPACENKIIVHRYARLRSEVSDGVYETWRGA